MRERTETIGAILDSADQLIAMVNPDGVVMAINRIGAEFFDTDPERLTGQNLFDLLPSDFGIRLADQIAEVVSSGKTSEIDAAHRQRIFHLTVYPVSGNPPRVVVYAKDVTDRVAAEIELRREREQLAQSLTHI